MESRGSGQWESSTGVAEVDPAFAREHDRQQMRARQSRVRADLLNMLGVATILEAPGQIERLANEEGVKEETCAFAIEELVFSRDERAVRRGLDAVRSLFAKRSRRATYVWKEMKYARSESVNEAALSGLDLPTDAFLRAWKMADFSSLGQSQEMDFLLTLEQRDRGSVGFLHQEFGITVFGRYPTEVLLKQRRKASDTERPYGVVIAARADHKEAFYRSLRSPIQSLADDLYDVDGLLRVIEVESKTELARRLLALNARYGETQKIQFALVAAHGAANGLWFDERPSESEGERQSLTISDLTGRGIRRGKTFFIDRPSVVLASCSSGFENGIGQELSVQYDADVTAPNAPTNALELHADMEDGRIVLSGTFVDREQRDVTERYRSGNRNV